MKANLYEKYKKDVIPALQAEFGLKNVMQVPKIQKVVVNVGVGKHVKDAGYVDNVVSTLTKITGQKPIKTKAKKSISNFKIREGMEVGVAVTLRGERMYHFLEKLINFTFPRVRDFRGLSDKGIDRTGNFSIGFKENLAFPEIKADEVDKTHGLQVVIHTNAGDKAQAKSLLDKLGFPFTKTKESNK